MSQLGERLRTAREKQGISLSQAAIETRILQRYLVALEDGDYQHLPGDVYARGFVRNYANYLSLPVDETIELYRRERGVTDPIRVVPVTSAPRIRGLFIPSFFGVFFIVLALVALSYLALNATNNINTATNVAEAPTETFATPEPLATAPAPTSTPETVVQAPTAALPAATSDVAGGVQATPQPSPTSESNAPINFEVRIREGENPGSWLGIDIDGQRVYAKILGPGQSLQFGAQRDVRMRVGNAGVVSVTINGQAQPQLGGDGQAVTFTWPS